MPYPVHWTSLAIGYESEKSDSFSTTPPSIQTKLQQLFRPSAIARWASGGHTLIVNKPTLQNHGWVAEVIMAEINNELQRDDPAVKPVKCRTDLDLCKTIVDDGVTTLAALAVAEDHDKDKHTRCILRGGRWYNERTYRLWQPAETGPWKPDAAHQGSAFLIATLAWPCFETKLPSAENSYL